MTVRGVLAQGRTRHESLMLDQCEITRPGGEPVFDPSTGEYTEPPDITIYSGKCRIKPQYAASETQAGEKEVVLRRYELQLPFTASEPVDIDDMARITVSDDTWLVDRPMPVTAVEVATARTARHLTIRDQS